MEQAQVLAKWLGMAKTAKAGKAKRIRKPAAERKPRAAKVKKSRAAGNGRVHQVFRLVDGIPDSITAKAALAILKAIEKRGTATKMDLAADLGAKFPDPTLRFNLWKLRLAKIVTTK